ALYALASSVAMTALGKSGLQEMAYANMQKSRYLKAQLKEKGIPVLYSNAFFNEIVIQLGKPIAEVNQQLLKEGFIGGLDLGMFQAELEGHMLVATTEKRSKDEIDAFVTELGDNHAN